MTHSGTSCGLDDNLNWEQCGGNQSTFPQATIYDSLYASNVSFKLFSNSTSGACPEAELDGVARHKEHCTSHTEFYTMAAAGTLPAFSYLEPPGEACEHAVFVCVRNHHFAHQHSTRLTIRRQLLRRQCACVLQAITLATILPRVKDS
jgi:hypothetical protein